MRILNVVKKFFIDYFAPCTILIGSLFLFVFLSNILFYIKRFYYFLLLLFFIATLISSLFIFKQKIVKIIHSVCFVFFLLFLGFIVRLTIIQNNPWAPVYLMQDIGMSAQTIYYQPIIKNLPTKRDVFLTYLKLQLRSCFNQETPINESFLGLNITFHSCPELIALFQEIFVNKDYYVALSNNSPTIIDCGSNEGLSILFFKMTYPNSKIIGFEPHPKSFETLRKNIESHKLSNITLINKAVYNTEGSIAFSRNNNIASQILPETKDDNFIIVNTTLLSKYITTTVDLLKMDIEGAESAVIEELAQHKKLIFIKNIIMEFHTFANKNCNNMAKTLSLLEENGFSYKINKSDTFFKYPVIHAYQNQIGTEPKKSTAS